MKPEDAAVGPAPIRVCHVITGTGLGGAETALSQLIAGTPAGRMRHWVISLRPEGDRARDMRAAGAQVESLGLSGTARALLPGVARLTRRIRAIRPQVVQSWMYHADLLGLIASRLAGGPPLAWGIRCSDASQVGLDRATRTLVRLLAWLSPLPRAIVANSHCGAEAHASLGYRGGRLRVIANGFDLDTFAPDAQARAQARDQLGLDQGHLLVGLVARFDPLKDHAGFLAAAAQVAQAQPRARFLLIGQDVEPGNPALARALQPPLAGRCLLLGSRRDMPRWYNAMDLHLNSSLSEGLCNAIGEAMACGVPNVVTDVGDSRRLVGPGGLVVPPRDPARLAEAILRLLSLPHQERLKLGQAARRHIAQHYSLAAMAGAYLALYREMLER